MASATGTPEPEPAPDGEAVVAPVRRVSAAGASAPEPDWIAAEVPLEVRVGGKPFTVLMRTPGHDEELVRGLFFAEGIIHEAAELVSLRRVAPRGRARGGDVVDVQLAGGRSAPRGQRSLYSNSACGVCGKRTLASLELRGAKLDSELRVGGQLLGALPDALRAAQTSFRMTGGMHASGLFDPHGRLLALREDVGRHNALDKLIGWALAEGLMPLRDALLAVSGRVSYELAQKAIAASIPLIAAVGAPSSLALELCERFGVTLVGFLRADAFNVYTCPERVAD
jgi:FdhD protein